MAKRWRATLLCLTVLGACFGTVEAAAATGVTPAAVSAQESGGSVVSLPASVTVVEP